MLHHSRVIRNCRDRRVRLRTIKQVELVRAVKARYGLSWQSFSEKLGVSIYTAHTAWGRGLSTLSEPHFLKLLSLLPKNQQAKFCPSNSEYLDSNWGQRKGIKISLRSQGIKRMGKINHNILHSSDFAEFVGIILGDGHVARKSVVIALNNRCEKEYADYICSLVARLFKKRPVKSISANGSTIYLHVHSTRLTSFLSNHGVPFGARKLMTICIPPAFMGDDVLLRQFLRGLVDTDGGVFRKSRHDMRLLIEFKNLNKSLLNLFLIGTKRLGFHPSKSGGNAIRIQTQAEVHRYAHEIGFSNRKNLIRYSQWTQQ